MGNCSRRLHQGGKSGARCAMLKLGAPIKGDASLKALQPRGRKGVRFSGSHRGRAPLASAQSGFFRRSAGRGNIAVRKVRGKRGARRRSRPRVRSAKSLRLITPRTHEPFTLDDYGSNLAPAEANALLAEIDDLFWLDQHGTMIQSECIGSYICHCPVVPAEGLNA